MMSPLNVLKNLASAMVTTIKGSPYDKATYRELFKLMYDLLRIARRDGLLMLERHVSDPHHSEVVNRYPRIAKNHHVLEFICNGLSPLVDGATPEQVSGLLDAELKILEEEHLARVNVLAHGYGQHTPGFGIVAAVFGNRPYDGGDQTVRAEWVTRSARPCRDVFGNLALVRIFGPGLRGWNSSGIVELGFFACDCLDRNGRRTEPKSESRDRESPTAESAPKPPESDRNGRTLQGSRRNLKATSMHQRATLDARDRRWDGFDGRQRGRSVEGRFRGLCDRDDGVLPGNVDRRAG